MIQRILRAPLVVAWVLWHVVLSSLALAKASLTPGPVGNPVLVRYPMRSRTIAETTALAWAITVTPGTLVVAIGERDLWVHIVLGGPRDQMVADLARTEQKTLSVLRGKEPR